MNKKKKMNSNHNFEINPQIKSSEASGKEKSLWKAVLMQAFLDSGTLSNRTEDILAKKDSIKWFSLKNKDFIQVCAFADLEPTYVIKKSVIAIQTSCKWRNDVLKQKRLLKKDKTFT